MRGAFAEDALQLIQDRVEELRGPEKKLGPNGRCYRFWYIEAVTMKRPFPKQPSRICLARFGVESDNSPAKKELYWPWLSKRLLQTNRGLSRRHRPQRRKKSEKKRKRSSQALRMQPAQTDDAHLSRLSLFSPMCQPGVCIRHKAQKKKLAHVSLLSIQ